MKSYLFVLITGLLLASCTEKEPRTDYVINGNAKDVYNGIRVYMSKVGPNGRPVMVDTAIVMNEKFKFTGALSHPELYYLNVASVNGRIPVMLENAEMTFELDKSNILESILLGSEAHSEMLEFNSTIQEHKEKLIQAQKNYSDAQFVRDSVNMEKDKEVIEKLNKRIQDYPFEFIDDHQDSFSTVQILEMQLRSRDFDLNRIAKAFNNLDPSIKNSEPGLSVKNKIDGLRQLIEKEKATQIGAIAPKFSAPQPDGTTLALDEVLKKGEITIIDFWAAWCGPCRRENPNVVRIYEKFHDKGLEIIGVGLDGRRGQQNPKEAWEKAIKDDGLTWHQVSNLKYFDQIAKDYNVNAIPAMFILDKEGKIIAKNLRGIQLENKVAELLN
ncbi:TlpA disulfide reductase family protein [Winogradskyella maritima]|uniref:Redoxin domain-containing protein n=1 Tax=Winogradskyella maritima TaxID=1517766 RepID=A0ABV8AJC0_9FLAO|nr:TlpA disulfide reductase family protein [Winogradskyella maritima]